MSLEELDELANSSFGMQKELFIMTKDELIDSTKSKISLVKTMDANNKQHK